MTVNSIIQVLHVLTSLKMPLTSPYPGPLSVLIMDNARIHRGNEILELADRFGKYPNICTIYIG
jgi:hypothetical protein